MRKTQLYKIIFTVNMMIILSLFLSTTILASNDEDLEIRIQSLKEREYSSDAITDNYDIEILTPRSTRYSKMITNLETLELDKMSRALFSDTATFRDSISYIEEVAVKKNLFSIGYMAKSGVKAAENAKPSIWMIVLGSLGCILLGYLIACLWHRYRRKK